MAFNFAAVLQSLIPVLTGFGGGMVNTKYGADLNAAQARRSAEWENEQRLKDRQEREAMFEKQRLENQKEREAQLQRTKIGNLSISHGGNYENPFWNIVAAATRR